MGEHASMDKKERNYALDLLRIFCCYCIIMLHVSGYLDTNGNFWRLVQGIVRPALWCFLALSGYFILSRPILNWKKFYIRHLLHLLIPLVVYVFVYQLYHSGGKRISLKEIINGDPIGHLWFVYTLIVLYLLAPFFQKMLENLTNRQLTGLLATMFFCGRGIKMLTALGFGIGIPTEVIGDCSTFFFLFGYWLFRVNRTVSYKILIPVGIINTLYSAYTFSNPILADGAATLALGMVVGVVVYYQLFSKLFEKIKDGIFAKAIVYISARTYGIYLIHMLIIQYFTAKEILTLDNSSISRYWMLPLVCLIIFFTGLAIATALDTLICGPLQKACHSILIKD